MQKLKIFAVATGLLLITAGVLSAKSTYAGNYAIYSFNGQNYVPLVPATYLSPYLTTYQYGQQAAIFCSFTNSLQSLWGYNPFVGYVKLYTRF